MQLRIHDAESVLVTTPRTTHRDRYIQFLTSDSLIMSFYWHHTWIVNILLDRSYDLEPACIAIWLAWGSALRILCAFEIGIISGFNYGLPPIRWQAIIETWLSLPLHRHYIQQKYSLLCRHGSCIMLKIDVIHSTWLFLFRSCPGGFTHRKV